MLYDPPIEKPVIICFISCDDDADNTTNKKQCTSIIHAFIGSSQKTIGRIHHYFYSGANNVSIYGNGMQKTGVCKLHPSQSAKEHNYKTNKSKVRK